MPTPSPAPLPDTSRRTVLRAAAVGGAALWAVPAVQVLSLTTSTAAAASGPQEQVTVDNRVGARKPKSNNGINGRNGVNGINGNNGNRK